MCHAFRVPGIVRGVPDAKGAGRPSQPKLRPSLRKATVSSVLFPAAKKASKDGTGKSIDAKEAQVNTLM